MTRVAAALVGVFMAACADDPEAARDELSEEDRLQAEGLAILESGETVDGNELVELEDQSTFTSSDSEQGKLVLDKEDRKPVINTAVAPYSSTVLILAHFPGTPSNQSSLCTGTLIAPDAVLTAAHCVQNTRKYQGVADKVVVVPGAYIDKSKQRALANVGFAVATAQALHPPRGFNDLLGYDEHLFRYDYAVIRLPTPLGNAAGVRRVAVLAKPQGSPASMIAYHSHRCERADNVCDKANANGPFTSSDKVRKVRDGGWFEHAIDAMTGSSGAGIATGLTPDDPIFALHIAEDEGARYNLGLLLDAQSLAEIKQWAGLQ